MIVPANMLSEAALLGMIEEFVTRDGTDYGEVESALETRVKQVRRQIETGEALIWFESATETTHLVPAADLAKIRSQMQQDS